MDFAEAIAQIWRDIKEAELPTELQSLAFEAGLVYYLHSRPGPEGGLITTAVPHGMEAGLSMISSFSGDVMSRLSKETGVDETKIQEVLYFNEDGKPGINGSARRLGRSNAERTRTIALLIAGARHFGNDEVEVSLNDVRDACKELGVYSKNNFASYLADMPGFILSGPKANRVLRAKSDAAERFRKSVLRILGEGDNE